MTQFEQLSKELITKDLFSSLKSNSSQWLKVAQSQSKNAFTGWNKNPIDTGKTRDSTSAKTFITNNIFAIRFFTPIDDGYEIFPFFGLSTSKKYGTRNWLERGAKTTAEQIFK